MLLAVHPRDTITFEEFRAAPAPAVALDGYVCGPSVWDRVGHFNFNHHEGSDRFTTRSTCEQVALAIRAGAQFGGAELTAHVNDDDPDVALSVWLLDHPELAATPEVAALCALQGAIDTCGGSSGHSRPCDIDALAWVIDPWASDHCSGPHDEAQMRHVIEQVGLRISAHVAGAPGRLHGNWGFDVLEDRGAIRAVVERHPLARASVCASGADIYVSVRDSTLSGALRRDVTVGLASPFFDFDLTAVWDELNRVEQRSGTDIWGGGNMVGGSPRSSGTALETADIMDVVEALLSSRT